jgi:hypothetical protein
MTYSVSTPVELQINMGKTFSLLKLYVGTIRDANDGQFYHQAATLGLLYNTLFNTSRWLYVTDNMLLLSIGPDPQFPRRLAPCPCPTDRLADDGMRHMRHFQSLLILGYSGVIGDRSHNFKLHVSEYCRSIHGYTTKLVPAAPATHCGFRHTRGYRSLTSA